MSDHLNSVAFLPFFGNVIAPSAVCLSYSVPNKMGETSLKFGFAFYPWPRPLPARAKPPGLRSLCPYFKPVSPLGLFQRKGQSAHGREKEKRSSSNFPTRATDEAPLVLWSVLWDLSVGSLKGCCSLPGPINITFGSRVAVCQQYGKQEEEYEEQNVKLIKILYPIRLSK